VVDDDWVATYDYSVARSRTARESNLLCLVQLTGARKQALLRAMTQATHCQLTEAADALVWPRPSLPATPARAIATSEARVCAVDSHGALTCCGRPRPLSAPAVPVTSWTQTKDYGCGLDANHHIVCSGLNIPAGADGAATFTQISAGPAGVCGVDVAQRISCWGGGLGPPAQDAAVTFSSVDATGSLQCGVTTRHEVRCWSEGREVAVRGSDYASVSTSSCGACAVTTGGDVRCWDEAGHDRPSVIPSKVRLVSDRCSYGCALDESGQPSCWGQEDGSGRTHPPRRVFRAVQSAPSYSCAVDERGNVACWGALQASSASSYTRIRNRMNTDLDTVTTPNEKRR
jgi:hypothetical protein